MPVEAAALRDEPLPWPTCPNCGAFFVPAMRGVVQRRWRRRRWFFFGPPTAYCALICSECMEIVGYEKPPAYRTPAERSRRAYWEDTL